MPGLPSSGPSITEHPSVAPPIARPSLLSLLHRPLLPSSLSSQELRSKAPSSPAVRRSQLPTSAPPPDLPTSLPPPPSSCRNASSAPDLHPPHSLTHSRPTFLCSCDVFVTELPFPSPSVAKRPCTGPPPPGPPAGPTSPTAHPGPSGPARRLPPRFRMPRALGPHFRCLLPSHHRRSATPGRTRSPAPSGIIRRPLPGSSPVKPSASLPAPLFHKADSPRLASSDALSRSSKRRSPLSGPP